MSEELERGELALWKTNSVSKYLVKKVRERLEECKKELTDGTLIVSPALEREYCRAIGEITGHEYFLKLLESED